MKEIKLSIVTPIYKDSDLVPAFLKSIEDQSFEGVKLIEVIFIIDGSGIKDEQMLSNIAASNDLVKVLILSRNFGQHIALSAGYEESTGNLGCLMMVVKKVPVNKSKEQ